MVYPRLILTASISLVMWLTPTVASEIVMSIQQSSQPDMALTNSVWRLERWSHNGHGVSLLPQVKLSFAVQGNQVNGSGGCNRFGGAFSLVGDHLSIGPLQATQRGCADAVMQQESRFFSALEAAQQFTIDPAGQLVLTYGTKVDGGVLYFRSTQ